MRRFELVLTAAAFAFLLVACGDDDGSAPEAKIGTVDDLLARVCELAADCVAASQEDIAACPAGLRAKLDAGDIAELESFTTLDKSEQEAILECFDDEICGRFGVALSSMSDSDLMEPLRDCGLTGM